MLSLGVLHVLTALLLQAAADPPVPCAGPARGRETRCVNVDRETGAVWKSPSRVRYPPPGRAKCGETFTVTTVKATLRCVKSLRTPGDIYSMHVEVHLVILADPQHPSRTGADVLLDKHDGFYDQIRVELEEDPVRIGATIEYFIWD